MDNGFYNINDDDVSQKTIERYRLEEKIYLIKGIVFGIISIPLSILLILDYIKCMP